MNASALARLLADPDRRAVVAALVLGATTTDEVRARTGLELRPVVTAIGRLDEGGLVVTGADDHVALVEAAFTAAARSTAADDDDDPGVEGVDAEAAKVMRAFVRDHRLTAIPVQRAKRLVILDLLAQEFEPGRRYSEAMVNLLLGKWHADTAALRRYLVDEGYLDRDAGQYWRSGGTVSPR